MFRPVRMPGPTTSGAFPVSRVTAAARLRSSGGTTQEIIAPETAWMSAPLRRNTLSSSTA